MSKKGIIIGAGIALITLLLLAPWVVGRVVERWVDAQMGALHGQPEYHLSRGWRRSRLEAHLADGSTLIAHGRHAPWAPPALAAFKGALLPAGQSEPVLFTGRLGLSGGWMLAAEMAALDWTGAEFAIAAEELQLAVQSGAELQVDVAARTFEIAGAEGPGGIRLEAPDLRLVWRASRKAGALAGALTTHSPGRPDSGIEFRLASLRLEPLRLMVESAAAWENHRHDRMSRDLALLGALSAWQEMRQGGLALETLSVNLDGDFRLNGRWLFDGPHGDNHIRGHGSVETLKAWAVPLTALSARTNAVEAESIVDSQLEALGRHGWLRADGDAITVSISPGPR